MKKIMFNDAYGLTQAVLERRKTMTRRIAEKNLVEDMDGELCWDGEFKKPRYKVGEIVAVAQEYDMVFDEFASIVYAADFDGQVPDNFKAFGKTSYYTLPIKLPGWRNKMFVRADLMPHQIRITDVRVERLQDISDEDCIREGIIKKTICPPGDIDYYYLPNVPVRSKWDCHPTPQEAFSILIDKISGKGTWESNPWVFVYEFELVK